MSNSVERVRRALLAARHPDTTLMFPDRARIARTAATAVNYAVAQIARSIALRAGAEVVPAITSSANRVNERLKLLRNGLKDN